MSGDTRWLSSRTGKAGAFRPAVRATSPVWPGKASRVEWCGAGERPRVFWWTPESPGELPKRLGESPKILGGDTRTGGEPKFSDAQLARCEPEGSV